MFARMIGNGWTTALGFAAGVIYYLQSAGATMPQTRGDWINLLLGAIMAGLGLTAKDATTGSAPK